jgi:MoCo/4Fe-4S cofactor protein with predicted Tat translocation signal
MSPMNKSLPMVTDLKIGAAQSDQQSTDQQPTDVGQSSKAPRLWRSMAEYENDPEFQRYVQSEFPTPLEQTAPNSADRRRFMQLMSASFALAGAAGCRWEQDKVLPMTRQPEGVIPGVPQYYHTAMELGGVGMPLRVKSYDGRPIKVDGNPMHPDSLGGTRAYEQGSVLGMYDPDRSRTPLNAGAEVSLNDFKVFAAKHFAEYRGNGGAGLAVLAESSSSKTRADLQSKFQAAFPQAQWFEYEAVNRDNVRRGSELAFGGQYRAHFDLSKADVVLALDADPLTTGPESLVVAAGFSHARDPEAGRMNRLWAVESSLSPTGIQADHRLAIRSVQVIAFAAALESEVSKALGQTATQTPPQAAFLTDPKVAKFFATLVKDLVAHKGKSAVIVGEKQPAEVHALGHRLNALLDNVGSTVNYSVEAGNANLRAGLAALATKAAEIKTLVILEGNPVYTATSDVDFGAVLSKIGTSIHLSLYRDETSLKSTWHVPASHYLEAWGDSLTAFGSRLVQQPLIKPLFESLSSIELLAFVTRDTVKDGLGLVRRALGLTDDRGWTRAVHDGALIAGEGQHASPVVAQLAAVKLSPEALAGVQHGGPLEVTFETDTRIYDGRYANNGWLQETPEHSMKLTWDNAAFINPKTAEALGVEDCHFVTLTVGGKSLDIPALISPGQAPGSIKLLLGFGRTDAGIVAGSTKPRESDPVDPVGFNVNVLRSVANWDIASGVQLTAGGAKYKLATTQDKHPMDDIGRKGTQERLPQIIRQDTFAGFKQQPDKAQHVVHHPPLLSLWHEPVTYEGYKWGMTIDLNKCMGCQACVMACNAENNIAIVGKKQVLVGREMHWLRIDRYWQGDNADEPDQVHVQPMLCAHCEHAPCEQVCPVGATLHSQEGLNDMAYNRCIGTRYCSNNCPYKVRRFNFLHFNEDLKSERNETLRMVKNPEVTVRFRGVMEKCTFCVQRIQNSKIVARNAGRKLKTDEVTVACQDACPSDAIVFGDLNDGNSQVAKKFNSPRAYELLEELNIRPRIRYLARITNPHPDLIPPSAHDSHGTPSKPGEDAEHGGHGMNNGSKATENNAHG